MVRNPVLLSGLLCALGFLMTLVPLYAQNPGPLLQLPKPRATLGEVTEPRPTHGLNDLVRMTLSNHPRLRQVDLAVEIAKGKALQAGLYPNPVLIGSFDELGDVQGRSGINSFPFVTQEIVTAHKLKLSRLVAEKEIDIASLHVLRQRIELITTVRNHYYSMLAIQQEIEILEELNRLAYRSFHIAKERKKIKEIAELEYLQFRVELNRWTAKLEGAERRRAAIWQQLMAAMATRNLPTCLLKGSLNEPIPQFEFDMVRDVMFHVRPEIQSAKVGINQAHLALKRAQVQKYPNVTVGAGFVRQNQNNSNDWALLFEVPLPIFNRNQGNIQSAEARVGQAIHGVAQAKVELMARLSEIFGRYDSARQQMIRYEIGILADTKKSYEMSLEAYQEQEFDYLKVLQAQHLAARARLEYLHLRLQAWQAASEIGGLLLQEDWPPTPGKLPILP